MSSTARDQGPDQPPTRGRTIVLEPTPPGLWPMLLGVSLAALAPLGGFLVGGAMGSTDSPSANDPMIIGLFIGIVIGGLGIVIAALGGVRFWRHQHLAVEAERRPQNDAPRGRPAPVVEEQG